jgi:hypothetical protein
MPEFQNRYGTGSSLNAQGAASYSWGKLLNDANRFGYDPKDDFLRNGVMSNESFTLSTGSEHNQTFLSASMLNSGGILPNNKYNRYNFTIRNTTSFLNDKMTLTLGQLYHPERPQHDQPRCVCQPLGDRLSLPTRQRLRGCEDVRVYDTQDKIYKQNWNGLISERWGRTPIG